jgi:hypothetical protein
MDIKAANAIAVRIPHTHAFRIHLITPLGSKVPHTMAPAWLTGQEPVNSLGDAWVIARRERRSTGVEIRRRGYHPCTARKPGRTV